MIDLIYKSYFNTHNFTLGNRVCLETLFTLDRQVAKTPRKEIILILVRTYVTGKEQ